MSTMYQLESDVRVSLPENDLFQIEDLRDTQVGMVNLIVRLADPVRLPARMQMAVKARFEPAVCEDTIVLHTMECVWPRG